MKKTILFFMISVCLSIPLMGQQQSIKLKVRYLSANHVYLDGGEAAGIAVNDTVHVQRDGRSVAMLKVIFVAENSANCEILSQQQEIQAGDAAVITKQAAEVSKDVKDQSLPLRTRTIAAPATIRSKSKTRISGYLSAQWYRFIDANNGQYDFNQPTVRFNLRARDLWGDAYNLRIRARSRYNERTRRFSSDVPQTEWRNRIYEFSFSYDNRDALFNYKIGRIISNKFSGVGYIDGAQLQHNISGNFDWGIFAGTQPEWQYSEFQTSYQKYGTYAHYIYGDYGKNRFESTLAVAGTYHNTAVSREVLFFQNNYNQGRKWNIYQSLEVDLNRDWRKKAAGEDFSLSGLYINGRYYYNDNLNFGLSYDNRKNYFTYELRSLADSLFDDAFRQGARFSVSYRFNKTFRLYGNSGIRKRENSRMTWSYSAGLNASDLFDSRINITSRLAGFSNLYTEGWNPLLNLSKYFSGGHYLELGYGLYSYTLKANDSRRQNQYARTAVNIELPFNLFLYTDYEYSFGDDSEGHRILAEIGYRL